jgi:hypothetical protein
LRNEGLAALTLNKRLKVALAVHAGSTVMFSEINAKTSPSV